MSDQHPIDASLVIKNCEAIVDMSAEFSTTEHRQAVGLVRQLAKVVLRLEERLGEQSARPTEAAVIESDACANTPVTRHHLTERFCRAVAMFMDTLPVPEDTPAELVDDWYAMRARLRRTLQESPGNYERAMAYEEQRRNARNSR